MPLFGRKIFITGGTRGLGRAMAVEFAARRADVCFTGRDDDRARDEAKAVEAEVLEHHPDAGVPSVSGTYCEVTDLQSVREAMEYASGEMGRITDVVANVGEAGRFGRFDHLTPEEWRSTFSVNLFGTYHTLLAAVPHLLNAGGGTLVGVSGYGAIRPVPFLSPYSSAKAAVVQLIRVLAREFDDEPLRFLTFSPGILDYGLTREVECTPEDEEQYHNPFQQALRNYLRKPVPEAARMVASLVDPANPIPSGSKLSLHRPFEVTWAITRARLKSFRG